MRRLALLAFAIAVLAAPAAHAFRLPLEPVVVAGNPADRLAATEIDPVEYDDARRCTPKASRPGVVALTAWLQHNAEGVFWGSYRCEKWGKGSASLHAENRAIDWHLDAFDRAEKAHAAKLIGMLLAPDAAGNPHALARRMGIQEIIWDCSYWGAHPPAGMEQFKQYAPCFKKNGRPKPGVDRTIAHRDHIHFGLTKAGAAGRTTFWQAR